MLNIDFSDLDTGDVPISSLHFQTMGLSYSTDNSEGISIEINNMPTFIMLSILKKNKFKLLKLIWVEQEHIKISGSINTPETLKILPDTEQQKIVNQILPHAQRRKTIKSSISHSIPYLVYLVGYKSFIKVSHIREVINETPESLQEFWAYKYLAQYLKDLDNIGYDKKSKTLSYLTAVNKSKEKEKYEASGEKYTLINFASGGCGVSLWGIDKLIPIHSNLKNDLEIVTLWKDPDYNTWINHEKKQKDKITWINLLDENGAIFETFSIKYYPSFILFDKNGKTVKKWTKTPKESDIKKQIK